MTSTAGVRGNIQISGIDDAIRAFALPAGVSLYGIMHSVEFMADGTATATVHHACFRGYAGYATATLYRGGDGWFNRNEVTMRLETAAEDLVEGHGVDVPFVPQYRLDYANVTRQMTRDGLAHALELATERSKRFHAHLLSMPGDALIWEQVARDFAGEDRFELLAHVLPLPYFTAIRGR